MRVANIYTGYLCTSLDLGDRKVRVQCLLAA